MKNSNQIKELFNEKYIFYFLASAMLLVPLGELISEILGVNFITQPYIIGLYGAVGTIAAVIWLLCFSKREKYPSDIFFVLLIFFATISLIFSKDIITSVTGFYYDELPVHFLAYYSFMLAGTMICSDKYRKYILYVFIAVVLIQTTVALFQNFGFRLTRCFFDPDWHDRENISYGLTQHNNWYAGLSSIFSAVSCGMFILSDKTRHKWSYLLLIPAAMSVFTSICSGARIALVGNAALLVFYPISFLIMKKCKYDSAKLKNYIISYGVIILLYIVLLTFIFFTRDVLQKAINEFINESNTDNLDRLATGRWYIWRFGLATVPKHWLTGVGLDNYAYSYYSNPEWHAGMNHNAKGHNEYIHILVTQGVPAVTNYILMLIYSAVTAVKSIIHTKDEECRRITWVFLGMFAAYAAQAFFNSSIINIAMYFWIIVGMSMPKSSQKPLSYYIGNLKAKLSKNTA